MPTHTEPASTISDDLPSHDLPRVLGPLAALACVVGSVIGSGIFISPARIAASVPYFGGIALVWVVAGLFSLAGALTLAELAAMMPRAGGPYVYLREAFGSLPAFLFGWTEFLVIRSGSVAALAAGFSIYVAQLIPPPGGLNPALWQMILALAAMTTIATINVIGTRVGGGVQIVGTGLKVASLLVMIVLPFALGRAESANLSPIWPSSPTTGLFGGFMVALIPALWAYDGWANAGSLAEDIAEPGRNVPFALFWGMMSLITLYLLITLAYHLALPLADVIACSRVGAPPIAQEFFYRLVGVHGRTAIALIVMISIYIALNGNALSGPRAYFAMARDGIFPEAICTIHPRFRTPANAIILQTTWSVTLTIVGTFFLLVEPPRAGLPGPVATVWKALHDKQLFDVLYTYVIFGGTIFYTASIASVFVLRRTRPDLPRPYKTWGYPITPALYIAASAVLLGSMLVRTPFESLVGLGIVLLGCPAYLFFTRNRLVAAGPPQLG